MARPAELATTLTQRWPADVAGLPFQETAVRRAVVAPLLDEPDHDPVIPGGSERGRA